MVSKLPIICEQTVASARLCMIAQSKYSLHMYHEWQTVDLDYFSARIQCRGIVTGRGQRGVVDDISILPRTSSHGVSKCSWKSTLKYQLWPMHPNPPWIFGRLYSFTQTR